MIGTVCTEPINFLTFFKEDYGSLCLVTFNWVRAETWACVCRGAICLSTLGAQRSMDSRLELDVLIYPDEVRLVSPEDLQEWELETASQVSTPGVRLFVALYPYNPAAMSPNHDTAAEELPFIPGQIIKVCGDKDSDGFYHGESGGLSGYVPSNMVAEIPVDDLYLRRLLMQQGFLPVEQTGLSSPSVLSELSSISDDVVVQRMVAEYDYDPWESSPNIDSEEELGFRAGDIIYVLGEMDQDGFYYGDLHGRRGLVPSNFLQPLPWD